MHKFVKTWLLKAQVNWSCVEMPQDNRWWCYTISPPWRLTTVTLNNRTLLVWEQSITGRHVTNRSIKESRAVLRTWLQTPLCSTFWILHFVFWHFSMCTLSLKGPVWCRIPFINVFDNNPSLIQPDVPAFCKRLERVHWDQLLKAVW